MGTHPIFESDFDCLTDCIGSTEMLDKGLTKRGEEEGHDCLCQICIDDTTSEVVQYYTVKSKFNVTTYTCLEDLKIKNEECECIESTCCDKPRHFVFLIDSSDGFNKGIYNQTTNEKVSTTFDEAKQFVTDFIQEGNFNKMGATYMSVIYFSGQTPHIDDYVPGSNGKIKDNDMVHYKILGKESVWRLDGTTQSKRDSMISVINEESPIDGSGGIYLALQDISESGLPFGEHVRDVIGDVDDEERILIIISDTEWDDKGKLKKPDGKTYATANSIIRNTRKAYDKIFTFALTPSGHEGLQQANEFPLNKLSTQHNWSHLQNAKAKGSVQLTAGS